MKNISMKYPFTILIISFILPLSECSCNITLHRDDKYNATKTFFSYIGRDDVLLIYLNVHLYDSSRNAPNLIEQPKLADAFAMWRWVWSNEQGSFLLKLPIDYPTMSLGLLATATREMDVVIDDDPQGCLNNAQDDIENLIADLLINDVTKRTGYGSNGYVEQGGGVCRSTYEDLLVTFSCCIWDVDNKWSCTVDYSQGWKTIWYGPLAVVIWLLIMLIIKIVADWKERRGNVTAVNLVENIKIRVIAEISRFATRVPLAKTPTELLSSHEEAQFMDIMAVSRKIQNRITTIVRLFSIVLFFLIYYGYVGVSIYYYYTQRKVIETMKSPREVALNVFNHMGWIFARSDLFVRYYGYFELVLYIIMPFLALFAYFYSVIDEENSPSRIEPLSVAEATVSTMKSRLPPLTSNNQSNKSESLNADIAKSSLCIRLMTSRVSQIINIICCAFLAIFGVFIWSLHVAYMAYFILQGLLMSLTSLTTWMLPAGLVLQYIKSINRPLLAIYQFIREMIFDIIKDTYNELLVFKDGQQFVQRKLMEGCYVRCVRRQIYNCVLRAMAAIGGLVQLFIVLYTADSSSLKQNSSSILGAQLLLLLPLLSRNNKETEISPMEKKLLTKKIKEYIASSAVAKANWKELKERGLKMKNYEKLYNETKPAEKVTEDKSEIEKET